MRTFKRVGVLLVVATSVCGYGCGGCQDESKAPVVAPAATVAPPAAKAPAEAPQAAAPAGEEAADDTELIVWASAEPDSGPPPLTVTLTVESLEEGFIEPSFEWNFGDGSPVSKEAAPTHTYEKAGQYTASVSVRQSDGQHGSDETWVEVE